MGGIKHDVTIKHPQAHVTKDREARIPGSIPRVRLPTIVKLPTIGLDNDASLNKKIDPTNAQNMGLKFIRKSGLLDDEAQDRLLAGITAGIDAALQMLQPRRKSRKYAGNGSREEQFQVKRVLQRSHGEMRVLATKNLTNRVSETDTIFSCFRWLEQGFPVNLTATPSTTRPKPIVRISESRRRCPNMNVNGLCIKPENATGRCGRHARKPSTNSDGFENVPVGLWQGIVPSSHPNQESPFFGILEGTSCNSVVKHGRGFHNEAPLQLKVFRPRHAVQNDTVTGRQKLTA
jgi:hypothetical protein